MINKLESLDEILNNLKNDPNYYNFGGMTEDDWMQECNRDFGGK